MASKKKGPPRAGQPPAPRKNTPLLFLLLLSALLFGAYYDFIVALAGVALAALLVYTAVRSGAFLLPTGPAAWCLGLLALGNALSIPFAVSGGMAFTGVLRVLVWILFFLYAATYTAEERRDILDVTAYFGSLLCLISLAAFAVGQLTGEENANGRIDGFFQYANSYSLFLLVCLVLLALRDKRRNLDYAAMAALLCGIFLSGSRGVFLLLLPLSLAWGVWYVLRRRKVLPVAVALGCAAVICLVTVLASGGLVLRRIQAITLESSSLNGRLLYYLDGLKMIWEHPMGVGRGGYLYLQPLYQTGVYTLKYIHNAYLQAALDGGILGGLAMLALPFALFFQKGLPVRSRAVLFVIAAHAFIDFDLEFAVLAFLFLLCGSGGSVRTLRLPRRWPAALSGGVLTLVLGYFSLVYGLSFTGNAAAAYAMFPADLALSENRLQSCSDMAQAVPIAEKIIASTDTSLLAWDCKFADAAQRRDYPAMAEYKFRYLRLNPYRPQVWEDFTALLEHACDQGSQGELAGYQALAQAASNLLEEVYDQTSPLAYRIVDKPDFGCREDIAQRLENILER